MAAHYAKSELQRIQRAEFSRLKTADRAAAIKRLVASAQAAANRAIRYQDASLLPKPSLPIPPTVIQPRLG